MIRTPDPNSSHGRDEFRGAPTIERVHSANGLDLPQIIAGRYEILKNLELEEWVLSVNA